jgi:hypothetical protein
MVMQFALQDIGQVADTRGSPWTQTGLLVLLNRHPSPAHVRLQRNLQRNPHAQASGAFGIAPKLIALSAEPRRK